jgi:hypothetical protein
VVRTEPVLVIAIIDGDLDADGGVDQTDHCSRDTNIVRVASISGTCKAMAQLVGYVLIRGDYSLSGSLV